MEQTVKILLTGEGATDYGWKSYATTEWHEGAVAKLIHSLAARHNVRVAFQFADRKDIEKLKLQQKHLQGIRGKGIPARKFQIIMKQKGENFGVFYCDADRSSGEDNTSIHALKRFNQV